ncbi:guanylate kinase [Candidatus Galacturonibacter soehngenii]|uniref:Guanylate kinase n=1 Tax=Candidatus Galacturonatibacter soehngenii TaxID=2307010 RepID=A0A7V7QIR8_9FIRM|nr:guanylate kinase [Candidatus Galacturonibacter soehngenii]KAB1436616.1 guanylate kinase [Candidatus Galacturonibacter soehngenii]
MGKIFYIMGKSSSGKDTIYKRILEKNRYQLKRIVMYTTRPIREGETDGIEYIFVNDNRFLYLQNEGKIIEARSYQTTYGEWKYFTVNDDQIDLKRNNYLMIGTLESFIKTKKYYGNELIVPIYIEVEDGLRLERALTRERQQTFPKYEEMCRRFLADQKDFSEDKIVEAGISKRFQNHNLEECIIEVSNYINQVVN